MRSIPDRIAACASDAPGRTAIADEVRQLTYGELDAESDALAARLRDLGAGPERCVGLLFERSAQFVVAALATLKCGAAYVPLDSSTPSERASLMLSDAGVVALVIGSASPKDLPKVASPTISMDTFRANGDRRSAKTPIEPDSLAYLVYTSGSTGRPKGVEITHRSLDNLIAWHHAAFAVTEAERASQIAAFGFDAAGWEIWPYLTVGASLYVADAVTRSSPELLADWLVARQITVAFVPTLFAEHLFRVKWPVQTALRLLLTGGDTLHHRPPAGLPFTVVNNYGPTECTVVATSGRVTPECDGASRPSIGRPIANATVLVVDEDLNPVPRGVPGELCIGGAPLARGYHNLPELTAQRFVDYAAAGDEPQRVYRTGDRARLLENDEIEFLGRFDDQVKVRGYRIELGEIEARLNRLPQIEASKVVLRDDDGRPTLVGYLVAARDAHLSEAAIREFLAPHLPDYMIPSTFVAVSALPLTAHGKVDPSALPMPSRSRPPSAAAAGAPNQTGAVQGRVSAIVSSLLDRPSVDPDDNFFMIGGHSMLAVQLVARLRETFGVKLTLRQLFLAPTVVALSEEVRRQTGAA